MAAALAITSVALWAGSAEHPELEILDSGIYDAPQLYEKIRAAGVEVYLDAQVRNLAPELRVYVSAGRYSPGELLDWVNRAIGLAVREIGAVKFVTFPDDETVLHQEQADGASWLFARETIAAVAGRYADDLPFEALTYYREQPERFASFSPQQREVIWEGLALRAVSEARSRQGLGPVGGRGVRIRLDEQTSARLEEMLHGSGILVRPTFDVYVHKCPADGGYPIHGQNPQAKRSGAWGGDPNQ